jgi:hypothetical protein
MSLNVEEVHDGALLMTETSASLWILIVMVFVGLSLRGASDAKKIWASVPRGTVSRRFTAIFSGETSDLVPHEKMNDPFSIFAKYDLLLSRFDWPI